MKKIPVNTYMGSIYTGKNFSTYIFRGYPKLGVEILEIPIRSFLTKIEKAIIFYTKNSSTTSIFHFYNCGESVTSAVISNK